MEKITIIIPVYNVEKYIKDSIESAINQTHNNLEIILINDESTDLSGEICEEYAKRDDRIKVVHQKNKGLAGARNTGLELATGKYIMFLDSDDTFELDACENLYNEIEKTSADFVIGNYINTDVDGTKWQKPAFDTNKYSKFKLSIYDYNDSFYIMNSSACNKIFSKSFLDKLNIKFTDRAIAEDAIFTTYCFIKSTNVYYIPNIIFNYRQRNNDSISSSCTKSYFLGINKSYKTIYNNFKENNQLEYYRYFYAKSMNYILYKFIDSDKLTVEEKIEVLASMKWFYMLSNDLKIPTILKSVQYIIEAISNNDYEQAFKYCDILNQVRKMLPKELKEKMSKPNAETYKQIEQNVVDMDLLEEKNKLQLKMEKSEIKILNIEESIQKVQEYKTIARVGIGELDLINGKDLQFQKYNKELAERLKKILETKQEFCLIGIPDAINTFENLTDDSEKFWINNMKDTRETWIKYVNKDMEYCTTNLTRSYIKYKDKSNAGRYFKMLRNIWKNCNIIICEGEQTRMGVGNDLFDNAKSIRRLICPSEDAFDKYDEILAKLKQESKKNIILLALGPTATVLAYDLAKEGYKALDIGYLDIEYEYFKKQWSKIEQLRNKENKNVNILVNKKNNKLIEYDKQIISVIG